MRIVYLLAGFLFLVIGAVGALLPLIPTTIFLILAAASFAKSSPRLEDKLLSHPRFGPPLRRWREKGAISRAAKAMALSGMAFGFGIFAFTSRPGWPLALAVAIPLMGCALYVSSRPNC